MKGLTQPYDYPYPDLYNLLEDMRTLEGIDTLNLILLLFSIMWLEDMRTLEGIDTTKRSFLVSPAALS